MDTDHFLNNSSSYDEINTDLHYEIFRKYIDIINRFIIETIDDLQTQPFHTQFIYIQNGLNILYHIFFFTFFYTQNLNSSIKNTITGMLYYTEFFKQIQQNEIQENLSYKDASIFVYSKTLFPINTNHSIQHTISKFTISSQASKLFQSILLSIIDYEQSIQSHSLLYDAFIHLLQSKKIQTKFEQIYPNFHKWIYHIIHLKTSNQLIIYIILFWKLSIHKKFISSYNDKSLSFAIISLSPIQFVNLFFK